MTRAIALLLRVRPELAQTVGDWSALVDGGVGGLRTATFRACSLDRLGGLLVTLERTGPERIIGVSPVSKPLPSRAGRGK